jgi:hypothetical protein
MGADSPRHRDLRRGDWQLEEDQTRAPVTVQRGARLQGEIPVTDVKAAVLVGVSFEEMARALECTGLAITRTFDPNVYLVTPVMRDLRNDLTAMTRRQVN